MSNGTQTEACAGVRGCPGRGEAAPPPAAAAMPGGADTGTAAKPEGWGVTHRTPQTTGMGAVPNLAHRLLRAKNWI